MTKSILHFAIFFVSIISLNAQFLSLSTQAELDAWGTGRTEISSGEVVTIRGNDITNIDALSGLTSIAGSLTISSNDALTNIDGLSGLTSIVGRLDITFNDALTNIDGLSGLTSIAGSLEIGFNNALTNIDALSGLTSIEGSLSIKGNNALTNIDALSGLTSIEGTLEIGSNNALTNIDALSGLTSIVGRLEITFNDALTNIDGLSGLTSIEGSLSIQGNNALTNIDALSGLTSIEGSLNFNRNETLTNIDGLSGLTSIEGTIRIIWNDALTNIDGLSGLTSIEGALMIDSNDALTNIDGLSGLTSIVGRLDITFNDALTNIDGLSGLTSIEGRLEIVFNNQLDDCCSLVPLLNSSGIINIRSNGSFCSSAAAILDADCGLQVAYETLAPCIGSANGSIKMYASNYDTIPFDYIITDANQQEVATGTSFEDIICIEGLAEGSYSAYITQPDGAEISIDNIVLDPINGSVFEITQLISTNSSNGVSNGAIGLEYQGGSPHYTINWSGHASGQATTASTFFSIDFLAQGAYTIQVTDANQVSKIIQTTLLDETIPTFPCTQPLDIVILNDVSGSVDAKEYLESKTFFVDFLRAANIGTGMDDSQAAIIEWSSGDNQEVKISMTGNLQTLANYEQHDRAFSGGTSPHPAMQVGADYLRNHGRPDVEKVIVLSTDGRPESSLVALADELKAEGFHIVTIAFDGAYANAMIRDLLRRVASIDLLAPGAPAYSDLDADLADNIVNLYLCPIDPGSSFTVYFNRDGALSIESVDAQCPADGFVDLTFSVSASRELSIPAGTPVSFYHNNPTTHGGATAITDFIVPCAIAPGESETYSIMLPIQGATNLFALLNDDGRLTPPFSFPITDIDEIAYSNNMDSIAICVDPLPTVQALKYTTTLGPLCNELLSYTIDVCNISTLDATNVSLTDLPPMGASLKATTVITNGCAEELADDYNIPAGCCISISLIYDATNVTPGFYPDQGVELDGPAGQVYIDYIGTQSGAEDVNVIFETCADNQIHLNKSVSTTEICEDGFIAYTFVIDNTESTLTLQGAEFEDILPSPMEWVFRPYDLQNISISRVDLKGTEAKFVIDEVPAGVTASFKIDAYTGDWAANGTVRNTAQLSNIYDTNTGNLISLSSNEVSTDIINNVDLLELDTITISADQDFVDISGTDLGGNAITTWTTDGDGTFGDQSTVTTRYELGQTDMLDTLISLFFSATSDCEEIGVPLFIKRECSLQFDPVNVLEVCEDQTIDVMLSWSGGIGPYVIDEISDVIDLSTSVVLSELAAGTYNYTLNDAMGCEAEVQLVINSISGPQTAFTMTEEHCDKADGSLTLDISSGIGPYTIMGNQTWTDIDDQLVLSDLTGGDYNFTITDTQGCSSEEVFSVQEQPAPEVQETVTQPGCDETEGSVILEWSGITADYNMDGDISAQNVSSPYNLDQLSIGSYQITLSDAFGCEDEIVFDILANPSPEASASATCIDSSMYSVQLSTGDYNIVTDLGLAANGIGPQTYEIINIPIDEAINITVTDPANGCSKLLTITPPDCSCSAIAEVGGNQEITCYQETVILDASASSQGLDFGYAWYDSNGNLLSTENQYETDQAGTYRFETTDLVNNCTAIIEVTVTDIRNTPEAIILSTNQVLTCENQLIELSVDSKPDVQYVWQHLVTGDENIAAEIMVAQAGIIQLSVKDTLTGCTNDEMLLIEIDTVAPRIVLSEPHLLNCANTSVTIDASGSDQGDFMWLDSAFQPLAESSPMLNTEEPGVFYYQLENRVNGCVAIDSVTVISNYAVPTIELADEISLNCNEAEKSILPIVTSDHAYELQWTVDQQIISEDLNLTITEPGTFILAIEDKISACQAQDTIEVLPANEIQTVVIAQSDIRCHGEHSGIIEIMNVEGGTPAYNFFVDQMPIAEPQIEELQAGDYSIRIVDAADCYYDTLITLSEPSAILAGPEINEQLVNLGRDVEVIVETNLAQENIAMVIWTPAIDCDNCLTYTFENVRENLSYQITVVDKNNCEESLDLRILVNSKIAVYLPNVINPDSDNNGIFFPQTSIETIMVKEMKIYDRWGNLVFTNNNFAVNDPAHGWDGSFNFGQAETGVYVYTIVLENESETIELSGDVTLWK